MPNISFDRFKNCFILVQNKSAATDEEWSQWLSFMKKNRSTPGAEMKVLVFSAGGSPTATQRAQVHELMPKSGNGVATAIVIGSLVGRTAVGAMSLFNKNVRAFAPAAAKEALIYLQVPPSDHKALLGAAGALHHQLGLQFDPT